MLFVIYKLNEKKKKEIYIYFNILLLLSDVFVIKRFMTFS